MLNAMRRKMAIIMWITLIAFFGTIIFSWGMGGLKLSDPRVEGLIAKVNDNKVKFEQYQRIEDQMMKQYGNREMTDILMADVKERAWEELLKQELIQNAIEKNNIRVSDEEIYEQIRNHPDPQTMKSAQFMENGTFSLKKYQDFIDNPPAQMGNQFAQIEKYYKNYYLPQKNFQNLLASTAFVTEEELKSEFVKKNIFVDLKYLKVPKSEFKYADSLVTDSEIKKYFDENSSEFGANPETRDFDYVFFSTERTKRDTTLVLEDIKNVVKELNNGEDFASLAEMYSEGPSATKGGDLGYFGRGKMDKTFEIAAFNATIGKVTPPVKTKFGYHVILVTDKKMDKKGKVTEVKASHILIKWKTYPESIDLAKNKLNLFKEALRKDSYSSKSFIQSAKEQDLKIYTSEKISEDRASYVKDLGRIPSLKGFLFKNKKNTVSTSIDCSKGYLFAKVKDIYTSSPKILADVKDKIISSITDKKAIESSFEALKSMESTLKDTVEFNKLSSKDKRFETAFISNAKKDGYIQGIGRDEELVEQIFNFDANKVVGPVKGANGSFLFYITKRTSFDEKKFNLAKEDIRSGLLITKSNQIFSDWIEKQLKNAIVEDYRSLYYR